MFNNTISSRILADLNNELGQIEDTILSGKLDFDSPDLHKNYKYVSGVRKGLTNAIDTVETHKSKETN